MNCCVDARRKAIDLFFYYSEDDATLFTSLQTFQESCKICESCRKGKQLLQPISGSSDGYVHMRDEGEK